MRRSVLVLACVALLAAPLAAIDRVGPGVDLWATRGDGNTFVDFSFNPIPSGFFCRGSAAFTGRVEFGGKPIAGGRGNADTIVERLDEATFNGRGVAVSRTRVRAIQLESLGAIKTSCGEYTIAVSLAPGEQPINNMRIRRTSDEGGFFTATLALNVRMTFQPVGRKAPVRTLNDTIVFDRSTNIPWVAVPEATLADRAMTVDTNADGRPDTRLSLASNFVAGWAPGNVTRDRGGLTNVFSAIVAPDQELQPIDDEPAEPIYHTTEPHAHFVEPVCPPRQLCPISDVN